MRLGIGSYTFAWAIGVPNFPPARSWDAFDLLRAAKELGVHVVQYCDNLSLAHLPESEFRRLNECAREWKISIELGTRGLSLENWQAHVRLAQIVQASFVRLVIDGAGDEPSPDEAVRRLRPLVNESARTGVRLAIENHDRFRCATLRSILEQLGHEHVGICLDTVNSFGALEGPAAVVAALGPWTVCLHVKDFRIRRASHQMGFTIEGCPAGQGQLNVPWLLEQLKSSRYPFNAILESWVPLGDSLDATLAREREWAKAGVGYLRTLIPETTAAAARSTH